MAPTVDVSLGSWFARRAAATPDRRALSFEGTTRTYAQFLDRVDRLAAGLRAGGVCRGDRVGFLGLNQPAFLETMFAFGNPCSPVMVRMNCSCGVSRDGMPMASVPSFIAKENA